MNDPALHVVRFDENGLIPAIAKDVESGEVLMLAYMNEEALRLTRETGRAHYWSRSRGRLWRKGETSGNEQDVLAIRINCERNSLLLEVRQAGAVCHDGYPTCYYRTLNADGSLTIVRERAFDPALLYGASAGNPTDRPTLENATRRQYDAYVYLRDHDLEAASSTSRRLRTPGGNDRSRIADELRELAGVLTGEHRHGDPASDALLEASQCIYWVIVEAVRNGLSWSSVRPDRALATVDSAVSPAVTARLLEAEAAGWLARWDVDGADPAAAHATLALVGQACHAAGVEPLDAVLADLEELAARPYLSAHFTQADGQLAGSNRPDAHSGNG